jgi:mannose-1-phosphate guanylyltransferase
VRAVVLVGGFGTRLRPLTLHRPKQMLPVVHRPMVERVVAHLAVFGVEEAVLSLGYRPDDFQEAYPDGTCAGVRLHYAIEPEPLDTAGAIRFAAVDAGIAERFLVVNGDVLTDLDVGALIAHHEQAGAEGTIALHRVDDPSAFGVVPTDADGRVTAFIEKPPRDEAPTDLINAGAYVLEPSVIDRIAPDGPVNVERVTFPAMVADGTLFAMDGDTYWIDAGTPETYRAANLDLVEGRRGPAEDGVHPDAHIDGAAVGSVVGPGASVGAGAVVSGSVVLPGATIGAGALVQDAIIGARARVGDGAVVDAGAVLGDEVEVAAGTEVHGARIPEEGAP